MQKKIIKNQLTLENAYNPTSVWLFHNHLVESHHKANKTNSHQDPVKKTKGFSKRTHHPQTKIIIKMTIRLFINYKINISPP